MPVKGNIRGNFSFTQDATPGLGNATNQVTQAPNVELKSGTGSGQADVLWTSTRTLTATSENLDLAGILLDAYGVAATFARVKGIYVRNKSAVDGAVLTIGGASSNAFSSLFGDATDKIKVGPGGFFMISSPLATGYPVTPATADLLKVDSGAATITYDIGIVGCSA